MHLIAGPCHLDSDSPWVAERLARIARQRGLTFTFKGSFDKANRTSHLSPRGPGLQAGLRVLRGIREQGIRVTTDVHETWQCDETATAADVLQIPAFLSRQTDLIRAAAQTGRVVHIKKGQFMSPDAALAAVEKAEAFGARCVRLIERGTCFGYGLVNDFAALIQLRLAGVEMVYDVTHSLQRPEGADRRLAVPLARAAIAAGARGLFIETHPDPSRSGSDRDTMLPLEDLTGFLDVAGCPVVSSGR